MMMPIRKITYYSKRILLSILIWLLLGLNRLIIQFVPFKYIAEGLGNSMVESRVTEPKAPLRKALTIGELVTKMSDYTPWESKCFVQALTAMELMKLFGLSGTIFFGVKKSESNAGLLAHAWVKYGTLFITGENESDLFHPVAHYGVAPD